MAGGEIAKQSLQRLTPYGRMVVFGAASGQIVQFSGVQLMYKNQAIIGVYEIVVGKQPTVGPDLSRPPPMYRPGRNPLHTRMKVLKLMIGLRLLDDDGATGRYIGGGRGKPAPTVGCLPTTISYTHHWVLVDIAVTTP